MRSSQEVKTLRGGKRKSDPLKTTKMKEIEGSLWEKRKEKNQTVRREGGQRFSLFAREDKKRARAGQCGKIEGRGRKEKAVPC